MVDDALTPQLLYEALSRGKREWELTFDAVPDLIFITDTRYNITRVNRALAERFGMHPSQLPGRKCYQLFHALDAPPPTCPCRGLISNGEVASAEIEERHLSCVFDLSVSPLYSETGELTACVHVARDITERKKAEEYRFALEQQLQQAQKLESLGVLSGGIAHDFNNILTIIIGHCSLARGAAGPEAVPRHLEQIELAANRAAHLCRQMLAYAGKSPLVQTEIDLCAQVREIVNMLRPGFRKNVSFRFRLDPVPTVKGDQSQVQQIVMNLIMNAVEAIGDGRGSVGIALDQVTVTPEQGSCDVFGAPIPPGAYACLQVSDNGCGMSEETRKRIFEPFFSTKFTGRGLGMSAIMGIIRSHRGALQLSSTPGLGSTFTVYFPVCAAPLRDAAGAPAPDAPGLAPPLRGTVLLVDDESQLRALGLVLLERLGCQVLTACNGKEALEIYRRHAGRIHLVLMDVTMPEMDGVEAYHELRKDAPSLPVLFCSGYGEKEVSHLIDRDPHAAFLGKPYRSDLMHEMLTRLWNSPSDR